MSIGLSLRVRDHSTLVTTTASISRADFHSTLSESLREQAAHYNDIPDEEQTFLKAPGWPRMGAAAIPERVADNSSLPFLKLPAELRNKIYSFLLIQERPIFVTTPRFFKAKPTLGLLSVCKQIRDEAREMFYASNEFRFHVQDEDDQSLEASSTLALWSFLKNTTGISDHPAAHTLVRDLFVLVGDPYLACSGRRHLVRARLDLLLERHFPSSRTDAKMFIA